MRNIIIISVIMLIFVNLYTDQVTIYNENFALIRKNINLELSSGLQSYFLDDIPFTIEPNSVIIKSSKNEVEVFSQNFEYDLGNINKIMQKYIGKEVEIITKTDDKFKGILQFNDFETIGITEKNSSRLILIQSDEVRNINLAELPKNFFLKPTLHWQLKAPRTGFFPIDFSYICTGMRWEVTYNAIWNDKKRELEINSWVTITNETGIGFEDTKLKLIAGDVRKFTKKHYPERMEYIEMELAGYGKGVPDFEEKAFHDFHLYTLSENVSINNNQTKQLRLFPVTVAQAEPVYEYITFSSDKVSSKIRFRNTKKDGLGLPLPKGIVKVYKKDKDDINLEFIGEDRIDHTAKDEEVSITTGYAFDLLAETKILNQRKEGRNIHEKDLSVTLTNRSEETKTISVIHNLHGYWKISHNSIDYIKKNANQIEFTKNVNPNEILEITWTERIEY